MLIIFMNYQEAKKNLPGVFHLEFFEKGDYDINKRCLEATDKLLQQLILEKIDLSRIAILTRKGYQASIIANYLITKGYKVQSADGMRIQSHATVELLVAILQKYSTENNNIIN